MAIVDKTKNNKKGIDIASFRAHFEMSRKYLVAYLDYLDQFDDVKKEGTKRFLT